MSLGARICLFSKPVMTSFMNEALLAAWWHQLQQQHRQPRKMEEHSAMSIQRLYCHQIFTTQAITHPSHTHTHNHTPTHTLKNTPPTGHTHTEFSLTPFHFACKGHIAVWSALLFQDPPPTRPSALKRKSEDGQGDTKKHKSAVFEYKMRTVSL